MALRKKLKAIDFTNCSKTNKYLLVLFQQKADEEVEDFPLMAPTITVFQLLQCFSNHTLDYSIIN